MEPSDEVAQVTVRFIEAMRDGDGDAFDRRLSRVEGFSMVGSDADEVWLDGAEAAAVVRIQMQETGGAFPIRDIRDVHGYREASVGWANGVFGWDAPSGPLDVRFTSVLHLEHGEWRMVQWHASVGYLNQDLVGFAATTRLDDVANAVRTERPDLSAETAPDGTVTIVFTDIEDSTRLTAALGDRAWLEILRAHNDLICRRTAEHGGTVVKGSGDGYMLAFSSARRALACSIAIQQAIATTFDDPGSTIRVRIGVHTGEVLKDADDFFGTAVNQAARVASSAAGGQIFASGLVRALLEGDHDLTFRDGPEVELKGLSGTHLIHELVWETAQA